MKRSVITGAVKLQKTNAAACRNGRPLASRCGPGEATATGSRGWGCVAGGRLPACPPWTLRSYGGGRSRQPAEGEQQASPSDPSLGLLQRALSGAGHPDSQESVSEALEMSKDGISRTDAPRDAALRTSAWMLGTLRAGTVGCALEKEPAGPGRQHCVTAAVTRRSPRQKCTAVILPRCWEL